MRRPDPGPPSTGSTRSAHGRGAGPAAAALACIDPLTGEPGGLPFREHLAQSLRRAAREGSQLAVVALEIVALEPGVPDRGLALRRDLERELSMRVGRALRAADIAARAPNVEFEGTGLATAGGPSTRPIARFAVLLGGIGEPQDAARVCQRVDELLREPVRIGVVELRVAARAGVAIYPWDCRDADALLLGADEALERTAVAPAPSLRFLSRSLDALAADRLELERDLRRALHDDGFVLAWQPRVDGESRRLVGVEALLRWRPPGGDLVAPGGFLDAAEQSRLIVPIGDWTIRAACRQARAWRAAGMPALPVAVNVSASQFRGCGFVAAVAHALADAEISPNDLELELTEAVVAGDPAQTLALVRALKDLGVRLWLDAFGSGFSSFARLAELPVDGLRIDRGLVSELGRRPRVEAVVGGIVDLAGRLGLAVGAVGVETEAQRATLLGLGCRQMQGLLFARPASPAALERWWREPVRDAASRIVAPVLIDGPATRQ
jgi:EAL domain-containing protein (putative c-di-GMP-specific phosphodiesterase class I)/GGDEF domain-containing protein